MNKQDGIESLVNRALDKLDREGIPKRDSYGYDELPAYRPAFKKKRIKKARLKDDDHTMVKVPDAVQDHQLSRWVQIGYDNLWPMAVKVKRQFDRDPKRARHELGFNPPRNRNSNLMSTAELQRWFSQRKQHDPELAELPRDVADQILNKVVAAYVMFHKSAETNRKPLDTPNRTLRFKKVRFIARDVDDNRDKSLRGYLMTAGDDEVLQVNDRALQITKLGTVRFTAGKASRKFLRTANLRIMSALFRLHDDGKWRIRIHFKRLRGRLVYKDSIINSILEPMAWTTRTILIAGDEVDEISERCDLPPDAELIREIAKAGYHLSRLELARYKRDVTLPPPEILDQVAKVVSLKELTTCFISTTSILKGLQRRGIEIDAKYLQECLAKFGIKKDRRRLNGREKTSYYFIASIGRAVRDGVPDNV
jgi:hypothetical protein